MALPPPGISAERAHRLCKMLFALGVGPQPQSQLMKTLKVEVRGFYRDLRFIRDLGIDVTHQGDKYLLKGELDEALSRLAVPDLKLSVSEALELARGQSPANQRFRRKLESVIGPVAQFQRADKPQHRSTLHGD